MSKVLLINPSYSDSYGSSKASITNPIFPTLGLTTIAATARVAGHHVEILDLSYRAYDPDLIETEVKRIQPDVVGITATTPLMNQLRDISVLCKKISNDIYLIGGGSHPTALPRETLLESCLDAVMISEADYTLPRLLDAGKPDNVPGVWYRDGGGEIIDGGNPELCSDLDGLPMPAWDLYDPEVYRKYMSRLLARRPPVTMAEFSRGCIFKCDFCASKMTMGLGYRKKSPKRCAEEVKLMGKLGWNEFMLADDIFTSDNKWAIEVCDEISKTNVKIPWSCTNGIRVESADDNLFRAMKRAGCYRVSFGFESGSDVILKEFGKGGKATIEQGYEAVKMARRAGIDTNGFFLLGLSPDTHETMKETIEYARHLELDMLKFGVTVAFPGTKMFNDYAEEGFKMVYDWDQYHIYSTQPLFKHRHLSHHDIMIMMGHAYKRAILTNPRFIIRRLIRGIRTGEFFWDLFYSVKFFLLPATSSTSAVKYRYKNEWPKYDFESEGLSIARYQIVRKSSRNAQSLSAKEELFRFAKDLKSVG